jgi:hypothetical protein
MAHRRKDGHVSSRLGKAPREISQRMTRTNLEQNLTAAFEQRLKTVAEPNRPKQMPDPILRIRRLGFGNPGPGQVRDVSDPRRPQLDFRERFLKRIDNRFHHPRVERVRGV